MSRRFAVGDYENPLPIYWVIKLPTAVAQAFSLQGRDSSRPWSLYIFRLRRQQSGRDR